MSTPDAAPRQQRLGLAWGGLIDAAVLFALLGLGVLGFHLAYGGDVHYLIAGFGGITLGLGLAALSARTRMGALLTLALAMVVYLLFGSLLATPTRALLGFLPSLDSLKNLLLGVVFAWKDMLTVGVPVGISEDLLVVPYLASFICALAAGLILWRGRRVVPALLPVLLLFVTGIAFSTSAAFLTIERGLALGVIALIWAAYRRARLRRVDSGSLRSAAAGHDADAVRRARINRLALGAAVMVGAVALTALAAPTLAAPHERKVLRNVVVPPFDPRNYITPLASFRSYVKDMKDQTLFEVSGLPRDGRVRLAALDHYNGTVFNLDPAGGGNFNKLGDSRTLSQDGAVAGLATQDYQLGITVKDYQGYFVPGGTKNTGFEFAAASPAGAAGLYFNQGSDTAVSTQGLGQGDAYKVAVQAPVKLEHGQLTQYTFASVNLPEPDAVPAALTQRANDIAADAPTPIDQVRQIEAYFRTKGAFSNGLVSEGQVPSVSGHGSGRLNSLFTAKQMLGDDEQYATAMALICRELGIPARVVMGFYPDPKSPENGADTIPIKGSDVHAWVEVAFDRVGWVAFDPTPPKDNVPIPPDPQKSSKPKPQVLQPPPPPQEPAELPPDSQPQAADAEKKKTDFWAVIGPILAAVGLAAIPLAVLLLPLLLIVLLKARRRKRRCHSGAPTQRFSGGWKEVVSFATDLGAGVDARTTRREASAVVAEALPGSAALATALAERADQAVFSPGEPDEEQARDYWRQVDQSLLGFRKELGFWRRQRVRFSPRSLLLDARAGLARSGESRRSSATLSPGSRPLGQGRTGRKISDTPQRNDTSQKNDPSQKEEQP